MQSQEPAEPRNPAAPEDARQPYHAPELRALGSLTDVTQSGAGSANTDATYVGTS